VISFSHHHAPVAWEVIEPPQKACIEDIKKAFLSIKRKEAQRVTEKVLDCSIP
jgi:hypothetical protein